MIKKIGFGMLSIILLATACKKYADPPPYFEAYGTDSTGSQRKVLIISIDGASGDVMKAAKLPNINALLETSKYSFSEIKDVMSTDAASWTTLLTGVGFSKHQIYDSSFQYVPGGDVSQGEDESTPYFPNTLNYLLQQIPEYKTALITPWAGLAHYSRVADHALAVKNDAAVKDSAVRILKENTLGVMILDFNSVELAGNAGKYDLADGDFKAALDKVDGYIGDVVKALKARDNAASEDWLIMVTTNRGGSAGNPKNGFIIVSNPKLKKEELNRIGLNTVHFVSNANNHVSSYVPDDKGLYNMGSDKDFTVQFQVNFLKGFSWPGFLGKSTGLDGSKTTGWTFMQVTGSYAIVFGGTDNGGSGKQQINATATTGDNRWHTITLTVKTDAGKRFATLYTDGKFDVTADITSRGNLNTQSPLRLGYNKIDGSMNLDYHLVDLEIFDKALDASTIAANIALKDITKHPDYNNLIGYWPVDDGGGGLIANKAPVGYDLQLTGPFRWDDMGADVPVSMTPTASIEASVIPVSVDVVANMFYWLKIETIDDWKLDGAPWLTKFEREIYQQ